MSDLVLSALQTALYSTLNGDATLSGMIQGVYDHVPQEVSYPYVRIGDATSRMQPSMATQKAVTEMQLFVLSREGGRAEALAIMERITTLLHQQALSISGHSVVQLQQEEASVVLLGDGITYRGQMRLGMVSEAL